MRNHLHPEPLMNDLQQLGESSDKPKALKLSKGAKVSELKAEQLGKVSEPQSSEQVTIPLEPWPEMVRLARIGEHSERRTEAAGNAEPAIAHVQAVQETPRPFAEMSERPQVDFNAYKLAATVAALRRRPLIPQ